MTIYLYNVLHDKLGSLDKPPLPHSEILWCLKEEHCRIELLTELATFFHGIPLFLERMTDKLLLWSLGNMSTIFLKMNG